MDRGGRIPAVLVVEDNPITRKLIRVALAAEACEVREASDGRTALALIDTGAPDLVLLDLHLPDMDGLELARRLRAAPGGAQVPILACTGFASALDREAIGALGLSEVLVKPVEPSRIVQAVRAHLPGATGCAEQPGHGRRILVVDDDPLQAKLLGLRLGQLGFDVATASSGQEALEQVQAGSPDAIVTDTLMPGVDGFRLCLATRRHGRLGRIPVVMYSSTYLEDDAASLARKAGASAFVARTPDFQGVVKALLATLESAPPVPSPAPVDALLAQHTGQVARQLERQIARNAALAEGASLQAATLAVLSGTSETLARADSAGAALPEILAHCLNAAAIPMGAFYLMGSDGGFTLGGRYGYADGVEREVADAFGHAALLRDVAAAGVPVSLPGDAVPAETAHDFLGRAGGISALIVPLVASGEPCGVILMVSESKDLAADHWLGFARALAVQFAQTIHLARRRREAEALAQAAQTLTGSLDVQSVAERTVEAVLGLFGVPSASFRVRRADGSLEVLAARPPAAHAARGDVTSGGLGVVARVAREGQPIHSSDRLNDARYHVRDELRARILASGLGAILAVPIRARDEVAGVLSISDRTGRVFTPVEVTLLQTFADQAAVALENARHFEEVTRQRREAEVIAEVARTINASLDVHTILQRVTDAARELCRSDLANIALREGNAETMVNRYWVGLRGAGYGSLHVTPGKGLGGLVLETGRPCRTDNYTADPRLVDGHYPEIRAEGIVASLAVPIRIDGRVEGLLFVDNRSARPFGDRDEAVLGRLADHAAIAIQNAGLFERLRESEARKAALLETLRSAEARLKHLLASAPVVLYSARPTAPFGATFVSENVRAQLGYEPREFTETPRFWAERIHPEDAPRVLADMPRLFEQDALTSEYRFRHRDGSYRWMYDQVRLLRDGDGAPVEMVGYWVDVTHRKQGEEARAELEAQLRQAQKLEALGALAGGVAHDFNNLLTVIGGRSQILLQRLAADDPSRRHAQLVLDTTQRASDLTRHLLAFSRKQTLEPRVLDLNQVLSGMEKMLRRLIGEDIDLVTVPDPALGRVTADPTQLEQVVMNLVVNSRDAMPKGGRLILKTANVELDAAALRRHPDVKPGSYVCLEVSDTGCGMDAETRARIFEPFFTTKEPGKGTGLGLATVFGIVRQSEGHIAVYSEPGLGATFQIYLPRVEALAESPAAPPPAVEARPGSETVLLVEDDAAVRELVSEMLGASGYTVLVAVNGQHALRLAAQTTALHLLVTDVVMPQMSGRELAERLRATHPETRALYITGYTDEAVGRHGLLEPGTPLLKKPFTVDVLARRVREVLDGNAAA